MIPKSVIVTGSFDGWLHHRLQRVRSSGGDVKGKGILWMTSIGVRHGVHSYKFLVDGRWKVDESQDVVVDGDGVKVNRLVVEGKGKGRWGVDGAGMGRSGSFKKVGSEKGDEDGCHSKEVGVDKILDAADTSRKASRRRTSYHKKASGKSGNVRRSLLQRMSSGFMRRLSVKSVSNDELDTGLSSRSAIGLMGSSSSVSHSGSYHQSSKFGEDHDKENSKNGLGTSGVFVKSSSWRTSMKNNPRGSASRGSSRHGIQIQVSRPTKVDEPQSIEEVEKQAEGWRDMARHLQEDLKDPSGARELLVRAVEHREKHGRWCTFENAQTHVDLARSLSKSNKLTDAEFHLRIALRVYNQIKVRAEHLGDLLHYIGVVVDRQKRRAEAEELYRKALDVYKDGRLTGDNVDIALKNLSLCLKKQGREVEAEAFVRKYYGFVNKTKR